MYVFFFKQKTAYEMRISDWSSDVCSSDLLRARVAGDLHDDCRLRLALAEGRRAVGNLLAEVGEHDDPPLARQSVAHDPPDGPDLRRPEHTHHPSAVGQVAAPELPPAQTPGEHGSTRCDPQRGAHGATNR